MGELSFFEDWDLQAVVRGCNTGEAFANLMMNGDNPSSLVSPFGFDQDFDEILSFPDVFDHGVKHEFGKPLIYPNDQQQVFFPKSIITTTSSSSIPSCKSLKEPEKLPKKHLVFQSDTPASFTSDDAPMTSKSKRSRKNQQKREVKHVKADGLSCDMWAWRKYGQKPIKGSPYPRSYYRCSSLKGCLARKQVERSSSDPSMFIITYTAEHSHAYPTRRNSLAGSTRIKSSTAKTTNQSNEPNMPRIKDEHLDTVLPSPTTPLSMASTNNHEDEPVKHVKIKNEEEEEEEEQNLEHGTISNEDIVRPDIIFSDELFPSLEDLEGLFLDQFSSSLP